MISFRRRTLEAPNWYLYYVPLNFQYLFDVEKLSDAEARLEYDNIEEHRAERLSNFKRLLEDWGLPTKLIGSDAYFAIDSFVATNVAPAKANKKSLSILWLSFMFDLGLLLEEETLSRYPALKVGVHLTRSKSIATKNQRVLYNFDVGPEMKAGRNLPLEMVRHGFSLLEKSSHAWSIADFMKDAIDARMRPDG